MLKKHHKWSIAVSAETRFMHVALRESVMETLSSDFADAEIETGAGNGRVSSYLAAHAEIYRQNYEGNRVIIRCLLPRHLLHHIQGPEVEVKFLNGVK